jgi:Protein of unknown function (DUF1579)
VEEEAMEMPRPGPEHERLQAFAGTWKGKETLFPSPWDPAGGEGDALVTARMACDGFFLVTDYEERRGGRVTYRGHGVYGWDPKHARYTMFWFDSMGDGGYSEPVAGTWNGDALVFQHQTPRGHARYTYDRVTPDGYRFRLDSSPDGETWTPFVEGVYRRAE